jgi:hypothetical protein
MAGGSVANLSVSNGPQFSDSRIGFAIGIFMQIPLSPRFAIQPEVLYAMKGDTGEETIGEGVGQTTTETNASIDYVEVPVLFRAGFNPDGTLRPFLYAGPVLGINVRAEADVTTTEVVGFDGDGDAIQQEESMEIDLSDQLHAFDFDVAVGGGVEIPIGSRRNALGLEGRYTLGIMNVVDSVGEVDDVFGAEADVKTQTFSILASFRWL